MTCKILLDTKKKFIKNIKMNKTIKKYFYFFKI